MVLLSASDGDIDTSDQCIVFGAYQKAFVVNGSNLKIVDLINCKLTHAELATPHAHGDVLTQATSTATMVVDHTSSDKLNTYGYVTSGTFNTSNEVTGSGSGTAFTPSATATGCVGGNAPHWTDWVVHPDGASGSLPSIAYLGCLYRGRCVLAGNPNYPHQWYMSRQNDPFDWAYTANDAQSPVAGNNADAGELGDIIRALIPYRDEYLIMGCVGSIWVLKGDPAAGGVLQEVDLTKGIFGFDSWCFDGDGNLYFASYDGIYMLPSGFGPIVNLSSMVLPEMFNSVQPDTHRVTLDLDRNNDGVNIFITTLATGGNSNYFYSLKTKGFFPMTLPADCAVYSTCRYDSLDRDYEGLLMGCTDGYIRVFDPDTTNDEITSTTQAIDANFTLPVVQSEDGNNEVKLISETVTLSGGASSGAYSDSDGVTMEIYTADDAETVIEDIEDSASPLHSETITGSGRANRIRDRAKGGAVALRFQNSTASETFSIERVSADIREVTKY